MQSAVLAACGLLLIGAVVRARIVWLQRALITASVAGGLVGLVVVQLARVLDAPAWSGASRTRTTTTQEVPMLNVFQFARLPPGLPRYHAVYFDFGS